jgi:hypothetical protein
MVDREGGGGDDQRGGPPASECTPSIAYATLVSGALADARRLPVMATRIVAG